MAMRKFLDGVEEEAEVEVGQEDVGGDEEVLWLLPAVKLRRLSSAKQG